MTSKFSRRHFTKQLLKIASGATLLPTVVEGSYWQPDGETNMALPQNNNMQKREIPSSGELLPVVGIGTWQQFDVSEVSEKANLANVLTIMLQHGGKVIDSSPMYGKAEAVIGEVSGQTGKADSFFYATKVWTTGKEQGLQQIKSSLQKMRREKVDLMQVHNLQDWKTHLETINALKKEGKIRYSGITHYTEPAHSEIEKIVTAVKPDFAQFNYSIRVLNAEKSLLKTCADNGVAVIINEPYERGDLFRFVKGKSLPSWAAEYEIKSWGQFFLKFILSNPAVTCVIPGTSDPIHVADNMGAGYGIMPDDKGRKKMRDHINSL